MKLKTVILDNGASTIKLGISGIHKTPRIIPNGVFRSKGDKMTYVGQELDQCSDFASLHYRLPFEKGYLVDWDVQKAVWDNVMYGNQLGVDPQDASLLITEPYFNFPKIQEVYDQFVFEEYEFKSYYRCTPASLMPSSDLFAIRGSPAPECMLIVDSGFSFTHIVPIMSRQIVWNAVKRIDVGGKLLTNHLKELISFRQWNMMDETHIINHVKETCCYVSQNFKEELEICKTDPQRNPIVREYILPDFSTNRQGRIKQPNEVLGGAYQILHMNNERFTVPEILFRPDDIGMEQSGIPATIAASIALLPEDLQGMFWANIGLIGGSTKFDGFRERLTTELRTLAPNDCDVAVYQAPEPILSAFNAAMTFVSQPSYSQNVVTRSEYLESGSSACWQQFSRDWRPVEQEGGSRGRGRARDETDWDDDEEEDVVVTVKRGTKGKGRAASAATKKK